MDKPLYEVVRDYEVYMTKKVNSCHERIGQLEEEKVQLNELYVQAKEQAQDWAEKHGRLSVELERAKAELMRLTNSITYTQLMSDVESLKDRNSRQATKISELEQSLAAQTDMRKCEEQRVRELVVEVENWRRAIDRANTSAEQASRAYSEEFERNIELESQLKSYQLENSGLREQLKHALASPFEGTVKDLQLKLALTNAQREAEKETRMALEMEITRLYKKVQGLENR